MKPITKLLIAVPLLLALFGRFILKTNSDLGFYCILFSNLTMIVLLLHLIKETKNVSVMYTIILVLGILQLTGSVFKVLHWPFSGIILLLGFAGAIVTALTLVSTSLKNETKTILVFQLLLGIALLIQCALTILSPAVALSYGSYLNYPVIALSATILFNRTQLNNGERNILLLVLMQGLFFLFQYIMKLI